MPQYKFVDGERVEMTPEEESEFEASRATYSQLDYAMAIEGHLNATAASKGYSSSLSVVSYSDDPNPQYAAEAAAFKAWRSAVWSYVYEELAKVQGGLRLPPSPDELVADLPAIDW